MKFLALVNHQMKCFEAGSLMPVDTGVSLWRHMPVGLFVPSSLDGHDTQLTCCLATLGALPTVALCSYFSLL